MAGGTTTVGQHSLREASSSRLTPATCRCQDVCLRREPETPRRCHSPGVGAAAACGWRLSSGRLRTIALLIPRAPRPGSRAQWRHCARPNSALRAPRRAFGIPAARAVLHDRRPRASGPKTPCGDTTPFPRADLFPSTDARARRRPPRASNSVVSPTNTSRPSQRLPCATSQPSTDARPPLRARSGRPHGAGSVKPMPALPGGDDIGAGVSQPGALGAADPVVDAHPKPLVETAGLLEQLDGRGRSRPPRSRAARTPARACQCRCRDPAPAQLDSPRRCSASGRTARPGSRRGDGRSRPPSCRSRPVHHSPPE